MYKFAIGLFASTTGLFSEHLLAQDDARSDGFEKWLLASFMIVLGGQATAEDYTLETIAEGLNTPWSIAELPNGGFLITERPGGLKHVDADGVITDIRQLITISNFFFILTNNCIL